MLLDVFYQRDKKAEQLKKEIMRYLEGKENYKQVVWEFWKEPCTFSLNYGYLGMYNEVFFFFILSYQYNL